MKIGDTVEKLPEDRFDGGLWNAASLGMSMVVNDLL